MLPFEGRARNVTSVVAEGMIRDSGGGQVGEWPYVRIEQGALKQDVSLNWSMATEGKVQVTIRVDTPI